MILILFISQISQLLKQKYEGEVFSIQHNLYI